MVEQACEWRRLTESNVVPDTPCPPLPWAWHMAMWCFDRFASSWTGRREFHHPYPNKGNWIEQQQWNEFPLRAMRHVVQAERVYSKDPTKWTDEDKKFDLETMRGCEALDKRIAAYRGE